MAIQRSRVDVAIAALEMAMAKNNEQERKH